MGTTPTLGLPYPEAGDVPQGNAQIQALAEALDADAAGGAFNVATNVPTDVAGNTQLALVGTASTVWGGCSISGNALLLPKAGLWRIGFAVTWGGSNAGTVRGNWIWLQSGNTAPAGWYPISHSTPPAANTNGGPGMGLSAVGVWRIPSTTDGVRLMGRQDSGATLLCNGTLHAEFIRP